VLLVFVVLVLVVRQRRLAKRIEGLTRGDDGRSLESILSAHLERVHALTRDVDRLEARSAVQEATLRHAFQRVGIVRFNPFEDTGGNQSFAIALLDAKGDGVVISSLHARGSTRVYAKSVKGGKAETSASAEEAQALREALATPGTGAG
jgi:uncharacterized protein DUF4446